MSEGKWYSVKIPKDLDLTNKEAIWAFNKIADWKEIFLGAKNLKNEINTEDNEIQNSQKK